MTKNLKVKAVIFDYDGTIVDTESILSKLYPVVFKELGYKLTKEQCLELRSAGYPHRNELLKKWYNPKNTEALVNKIAKNTHKYFDKYIKQNPIQLKPFVKEVLSELTKLNIKLVIASQTKKERLEKQLKELDIRKYFDEVYSAECVKFGKPYSDIYDFVCYKLNLAPSECVAVEDCPNGVIAASVAGCQVIMVPDLTQPDKELKKNFHFKTIKSFEQLPKLIK